MNFYPFHIGDYASATRHLTWTEDAAYRRLLDCYYVREEALPADLRQVYRLVVASTNEQREAVDQVLEEFFTLTDVGYTHQRCEAEILCATDKRNKASQAAQIKWSNARARELALLNESERNANASKQACESIANAEETPCEGNAPNPNPNPNPNPIKEQNQIPRAPVGFAEFWIAYPKKVGKGAAESAWKKLKPSLTQALDAVSIQAKSEQWQRDGGQFIPNPATWLNQRRWEDGVAGASLNGKPALPEWMRGAL